MRWIIYRIGNKSRRVRLWYYTKHKRWLWGMTPFLYDSLLSNDLVKQIVDCSVGGHAIGMATLEKWCQDAFGKPADKVFNMVSSNNITMKTFDSKHYDEVYKRGGYKEIYFLRPEETPYWPLWEQICEHWIPNNNPCILDIGCGNGQFSRALNTLRKDIACYWGIDFSKFAIDAANNHYRRPPMTYEYKVVDITDVIQRNTLIGGWVDTVVILETLEHLPGDDDKEIIRALAPGVRVIISVPNFDAEGHYRWFKGFDEVQERYGGMLRISGHKTLYLKGKNKIFAICGTKL